MSTLLAVVLTNPAYSTPRCEGKLPRTQINERQSAILALLKDKKYDDLERHMGRLLTAYSDGTFSDEELFYEFGAFFRSAPFLEPLIQEWAVRYPGSFSAHHAASLYYSSTAWQMRGGKPAKDTSPQQFREFERRLRFSQELSVRSIKLHPKPILAYAQLMANARALRFDVALEESAQSMTDPRQPRLSRTPRPDVLPILRESIRVQPDNTMVRAAYVLVLAPRWGGSMEALFEYSQPTAHPGLSPDRQAAMAYVATMEIASEYRFQKQLDDAVDMYRRASQSCRLNQPFVAIANIRLEQERYEEALAAADAAIALVEESSIGALLRARALQGLDRHPEAVRLLKRLAPEGNSEVQYLLAEYYASGTGGVERDLTEARRLFGIAARAGNERAIKRLESLK